MLVMVCRLQDYCSVVNSSEDPHLLCSGVEHLLRDAKDNTIGTLSTNVDRMVGGLSTLKSRLLEVKQYLELVVAGKLPVNHDLIYNLQVN